MDSYAIIFRIEVNILNVEETIKFLSNGWEVVDHTPTHWVMEHAPVIFEGDLNTLKKYVNGIRIVFAVYDGEDKLIFSAKKGWI